VRASVRESVRVGPPVTLQDTFFKAVRAHKRIQMFYNFFIQNTKKQ